MKNAIQDIESFNITLKGAGVFPNKKYIKIIWVGIHQGEPIIEIAYEVGYQNISFFNRCFKKQLQMSPRDYRYMIRK